MPGDLHRAGDEDEHARSNIAGGEKRLACRIAPDLAEAAQAINFRRTEFRKHLLVAGIDVWHGELASQKCA
jgi:hypothetical protein